MIITFLGTGTSQGVPVIACDCVVCASLDFRDKRLRSSVLFEVNEKHLVVDTGPDFRQQMLSNRVEKLDAVLFTHEHKDHTAGLDDIRAFNFKHNMDMPLYLSAKVLKQLKNEYGYIFSDTPYPGLPRIVAHLIENKPFRIQDVEVVPVEVMHYKLPVFGFKINNCAYITDANFISEAEKEKLKGLDVLILNALRHEKHLSHFTLQEALDLVSELQPKKAYFTHISHLLGQHAKEEARLPQNVYLAYDGLKISV